MQGQLSCCPQGQLTCTHASRVSFARLLSQGMRPTLLSAAVCEGLRQFCTDPGHTRGPRWLPNPGTSSWSLVVLSATNPCCHTPLTQTRLPEQRHKPGLRQGLRQWDGDRGYSQLSISFLPCSISLYTLKLLHFSLSCLPTTRLHIVVAPTADGVTYSVMHGLKRP